LRLVRSVALSVLQRLFVEAENAIGGSNARIVIRHVTLNYVAPIIVQTILSLGWGILDAVGLSF
jgi:peptide/nickel transport system permease protein